MFPYPNIITTAPDTNIHIGPFENIYTEVSNPESKEP
jgi:hypothetical protein